MIATMPTAVVAVMPTPVTIVAAAVTATMPAVTATMPAPGVSLARHRQARERDCHAADQARKFHEGMSHEEIQAQPPAGASGMRASNGSRRAIQAFQIHQLAAGVAKLDEGFVGA